MAAPCLDTGTPDEDPAPKAANDAVPAASTPSLLRFITCGSVDDGKSTLIGRLLYEAGAVLDDQMEALDRDSAKFGTTETGPDFALLVDGLSAEREQGITIDVAYRYFATSRRAFIVADTPGHEQYTRNMATGASTADLAIILVDARKGLLPQTRRHAYIVSLVGVRHIVLAVNKMDLVGYDETVFAGIESSFRSIAADLGFASVTAIPVSAKAGENVAARSPHMAWHQGPALLPFLERIDPAGERGPGSGFLLPVQWVNRPSHDFRGYAGTIAAGTVKPGDAVVALPSGRRTRVTRIVTADGDLPAAGAGRAVTLALADEIDLSRGELLAARADDVMLQNSATVRLLATSAHGLRAGDQMIVKLGSAVSGAVLTSIHHAVDIENFMARTADDLPMNAIGLATLRFDRPLAFTDYRANRALGSLILIDRTSNETVAFGIIEAASAPEGGQLIHFKDRLLGQAGSERRHRRVMRVSWRLSSGILFGMLIFAVSGEASFALAAMLIDAAARAALRQGHDRAWKQFWSRQERSDRNGQPGASDKWER